MSNTNISMTFFDTDYRYFYNNHQFDILYLWCYREEREMVSNAQWKLKVQIGMKNNLWLKLDSNLWRLEFPQVDALTIEPLS